MALKTLRKARGDSRIASRYVIRVEFTGPHRRGTPGESARPDRAPGIRSQLPLTALEEAERTLVRGMVRVQETAATAEETVVRAGMDVGRVKDLIAEGPKMAPVKEPSRDADYRL